MSAGTVDPVDALERVHSCGGVLVRASARGLSGAFLLMCLLAVGPSPVQLGLVLSAGVTAFGAVSVRRPVAWTAAAAGTSLAATALATQHPEPDPAMVIEGPGLVVLLVRLVWRAPVHRARLLAPLPALALVMTSLRVSSPFVAMMLSIPLAVLLMIATGAGIYLRALDARRARAITDARRDERLELARDLHDFVAHHVTGIVVQAQAARFAAGSGAAQTREQLDAMLGAIERAGTEALTSMRRMVGLLRDDGDDSPDGHAHGGRTRPVGDLDRLEELVAGFTGPPASLVLDPGVRGLPPEVATSVHRIVQEALTNTRKHAADATVVRVSVRRFSEGVEVAVRDDGRGRGRRLPGGGFGLAGLAERVEALGGRLHAGPGPVGGWEVVAFLPVS